MVRGWLINARDMLCAALACFPAARPQPDMRDTGVLTRCCILVVLCCVGTCMLCCIRLDGEVAQKRGRGT
eukprot:COSAG01_NODE_5949_length_3939_cov_3.112500_1_plen_70_part_00